MIRTLAVAGATVVLTSGWASPVKATASVSVLAAATPATTTVSPVTLNGDGSSDPAAELPTWKNDLYGTAGNLNVSYSPLGGFAGRHDLLAGNVDFALSGVGFTPAELTKVTGGAAGLVAAPVMVSAVGMLYYPPQNLQNTQEHSVGLGSGTFDANANPLTYTPYTGPIQLPDPNLAAMLLKSTVQKTYPNDGISPLHYWDNPDVSTAMGIQPNVNNPDGSYVQDFPVGIGPNPTLRSDPSEDNYYTQLFASIAAPTIWADVNENLPVAESLPPRSPVDTLQGVPNQVTPIEIGHYDPGGDLLPVPPSTLGVVQSTIVANKQDPPGVTAGWVGVQNKAGQYVAPSPSSIDAAVNAPGGDAPLSGLTNSVSGAYPLTYVDQLYAPAHGLTADKTEAVATLIRYLVTDGQAATAPVGDGQLPTSLRKQALATANQLVVSNCTATGDNIVSSNDPGRYAPAPALSGLTNIGTMLHCNGPATPATDNVPPAQYGSTGSITPASSSAPLSAPSTGAIADTSSAAAPATDQQTAAGPLPAAKPPPARRPSDDGAITLSGLPLPLPWSGSRSFDRLTALLLGAGFFLAGRRPLRWLVRLARP